MGIDVYSAQFLVNEKRRGVRFGRTLTVGHQTVYMAPRTYESFLSALGVTPKEQHYADDLFHALGATPLDFMDASSYEGANVIQDLNQPIDSRLSEAYDCVFDGGTLEHVFNFPTALKNCMELVKVGGQFIMITPMNNYAGHGFYQFSPELFFNALSARNGFVLEKALFVHRNRWYAMANPEDIGARIELITDEPVQLYVSARRSERRPVFAAWPQQSDYATMWSRAPSTPTAVSSSHAVKESLVNTIPLLRSLQMRWRTYKRKKQCSPANRRFFTPVDLDQDGGASQHSVVVTPSN
jgi:SAM-dependent methyltransferase